MTALVWDQPDQRHYESGVDRGVLYPTGFPAVAWSGLTAIEESIVDGEVSSYYYDGRKTLNLVAGKDFQAVVHAFSAPYEFGPCIGERSLMPGFIFTLQPKNPFGLTYRTLIDGGSGYKIHLVYNALAKPGNHGYKTLTSGSEAEALDWTIEAVPMPSSDYKPSAHYIVDSTKAVPSSLATLEGYLYGTVSTEPYLPSPSVLLPLFNL